MRSVSYLKVENHENLIRDTSSHAIINTDDNEYKAFKARREAELKKRRQFEDQSKEIEYIKSEMAEIKQMLAILIKGK